MLRLTDISTLPELGSSAAALYLPLSTLCLSFSSSKCLFLSQTLSPPAPPFWATAKLFTRDKLVICLVFCFVLLCCVLFLFLFLMCLSSSCPDDKTPKKGQRLCLCAGHVRQCRGLAQQRVRGRQVSDPKSFESQRHS